MERLLTAREVATRLQVSVAWVLAHANGKRHPLIPSVKLGRSVRFHDSDVNRFVECCKRQMERGLPLQ